MTKQIWEKIREEFTASIHSYFLCHGSNTFENLWRTNAEEICALARKFVDVSTFDQVPVVLSPFSLNSQLFWVRDAPYRDERMVRLKFLDYVLTTI